MLHRQNARRQNEMSPKSGWCFKTNQTTVMDKHFSIVYSGCCFKTNRTTVLSCTSKLLNPDGALKKIGQQYCPLCTSKLSNPDGAPKQIGQQQWTCIKMVKFPFEFIILKMFITETYPFSRKRPRKRKFSRNFAKICSFSHHFRFRFRFNPNHSVPLQRNRGYILYETS
jgi:hypothetical protein